MSAFTSLADKVRFYVWFLAFMIIFYRIEPVRYCPKYVFSLFHNYICLPLYKTILLTMKKNWKKIINSFRPSYKVDVTMYPFIPGMPVRSYKTRHSFKKGQFEEAKCFFDQATAKTRDHDVAPVEINHIKGRRRVVTSRYFGPVKNLKQMRMSA